MNLISEAIENVMEPIRLDVIEILARGVRRSATFVKLGLHVVALGKPTQSQNWVRIVCDANGAFLILDVIFP